MNRNILKRALTGEKFRNIFIADCHCHMGTWYDFYFPKAGIDEMIIDADNMCIDEIYISPHAAMSCDYKLGNIQIKEAIGKYPEKVYGYLTLNPNNPEEIDDQFEKYYKIKNFVGVKLHPGLHNYPITGENYIAVFDKLKELGGFVLTHSWDDDRNCSIDMCEQIVKAYPEVALILGHAGGVYSGVKKSIKLVNTYENVYMDTSGFEYSNIWIEDIVKNTNHEKIVYGSDFPFHDMRGGLSRILFADIDDKVKVDILGKNFKVLISKYPKKV
ncbi:MAG: amidohydrolase family protein [Firmicutes bacterium]|nr:amidohydrolase family protein [Bacillota bacterium]